MQYGIYAVSKIVFRAALRQFFFYFKNEFRKLISGDREHLILFAVYLKGSQCPVMSGTWKMVFEPCSHVISTFFNFFQVCQQWPVMSILYDFDGNPMRWWHQRAKRRFQKCKICKNGPKWPKKEMSITFFWNFFFDFFSVNNFKMRQRSCWWSFRL